MKRQRHALALVGTLLGLLLPAASAEAVVTIADPTGPRDGLPATRPISGTLSSGGGVQVRVTADTGGGAPEYGPVTVAPDLAGNWRTPTGVTFTQQTWTITAVALDSVGAEAGSDTETVEFDLEAPTIDLVTPAAGAYTNDATPSIGGQAEAPPSGGGLTIRVFEGSGTSGPKLYEVTSLTPDEIGGFSVDPDVTGSGDGARTVVVAQSDWVGNRRSVQRQFVLDTTAPSVAVTAPDTDGKNLLVPTPPFTITRGVQAATSSRSADGNVTATFTEAGGSSVGGTVTGSGGTATVVPASPLPPGSWTLRIDQSDGAGNTGTATRTFNVRPNTLSLNAINDSVTTPRILGATPKGTSGEGRAGPVTVRIFAGTGTGGPLVGTKSTAAFTGAHPCNLRSSDNTFCVDPDPLGDGTYTVQASTVDEAGNAVLSTNTRTFRIDSTGPALALLAPGAGGTRSLRPEVSGTTDEATDVTVQWVPGTGVADTTVTQRVTPTPGSPLSFGVVAPGRDLAHGPWTVRVSQRDSLNNLSQVERAIRIDRTPPTGLGLTAPAVGSFTRDTTPAIGGNAGDAVGDLNPTIEVFRGSSTAVADRVATLTNVPRTGTTFATSVPAPSALSGDGLFTVKLSQSDDAGNAGSVTSTFTLDTTPPSVSVLSPADGFTGAAPPRVTGIAGTATAQAGMRSADVLEVTVQVRDAANAVVASPKGPVDAATGAFDIALPASLPAGTYTYRALQRDAVGNQNAPASRTLTVAPPSTPTPTATASPTPTATASPTPTATASPTPTVTVSPTPTATTSPTPTATSTATVSPTPTVTVSPTPTATTNPTPTATTNPTPTATTSPTPTPPDTRLLETRVRRSARRASFTFESVGPAPGFECALTRPGRAIRYRPCTSPRSYRRLAPGRHTFRVRALGDLTPAKRRIRI
jgi:large repetitive protein